MVGNFVLWSSVGGAVKRNLRSQNRRFTSPNDNFQYRYLNSNACLLVFPLKLHYLASIASTASDVKPEVSQWNATLRNDVGLPTACRRINRRNPIRRRVIVENALELRFTGWLRLFEFLVFIIQKQHHKSVRITQKNGYTVNSEA